MQIEGLSPAPVATACDIAGLAVLQDCPDFVEKLPIAIYACDAQGRITWFNTRAAALWGAQHELYFEGRQTAREETAIVISRASNHNSCLKGTSKNSDLREFVRV